MIFDIDFLIVNLQTAIKNYEERPYSYSSPWWWLLPIADRTGHKTQEAPFLYRPTKVESLRETHAPKLRFG